MLSIFDSSICIAYILLILFIGIKVGIQSRKKTNLGEAGAYFLAGKSLRWPAIGLALFATNISTVHLVSLAQSGFDTGLLNGNFEWMAIFVLIILSVFFVPFYIRSGVSTLPDFLEKRYDRSSRDWLAVVSVASAVIVHIAFSMLAGGIVLETLFGIDFYLSIIVICCITAIYTIIGGLKAVVVTESIQTVVLLAGAIIITGSAFFAIGGWDALTETLASNHAMKKLSMIRSGGDKDAMPWYTVLLGYPVIGIWYWCADQTIVQRVLGAKDERHARLGPLFCGFIKLLPVFIFVMPGLFAYALAEQGRLNLDSLTDPLTGVVNSKGIYTVMIQQLLPVGLAGLVAAALISSLMSQVSGALNSISTLVSYDLYQRIVPGASEKKVVRVGKLAAAFALILSLAILPLLGRYESIFTGLNDIIAHIAPPITCVFLVGICWSKATALSAKLTLWVGSVAGVLVFSVGKLSLATTIGQVPFLLMAFYLFMGCLVLQVLISLLAPEKSSSGDILQTWKNVKTGHALPKGNSQYKWVALLLLLITCSMYAIFR